MSTQGLSLERLVSFLAIADQGGISKAARFDPTRQSQLSRQLSELEAYFGQPLMERQGGRRVLNERGRRLAEHVRWMLRGLDDLKEGRAEAPPTFVLAAGDSALHWLVLPRIASVGATFEIVALPTEEVIGRLLDGSADLGIVRADEVRPDFHSRPLGSVEHALFFPKALARGVAPEELVFELPLALQVADTDFRARLQEHAAKHRRVLNVALRCESFPQVLRAVQSGRYAGLLPVWAGDDLKASQFGSVQVAGRHASKLHLAWAKRLTDVRPRAKEIIDRLAQALRESP